MPRAKGGAPPSRLTTAMKTAIVIALATGAGPSEVRDQLHEEFGTSKTLGLSVITYYDASTRRKNQLAKQWADLYWSTRQEYLDNAGRVPIAHKAVRLRELQKLYDLEKERKNYVGARAVLEQAAKEQGGAFTNKRELSGSIGVTIEDVIRAAAGAESGGVMETKAETKTATTEATNGDGHAS